MKAKQNRKTSPRLQKIVNPGPEENARAWRAGNPSGLENLELPKGRGDITNDSAATEKQNQ